jgi:hypothetical protein
MHSASIGFSAACEGASDSDAAHSGSERGFATLVVAPWWLTPRNLEADPKGDSYEYNAYI